MSKGDGDELFSDEAQRRTFLKTTGGIVGASILAGCSGGGNVGSNGSSGPSPPWTTEDLAEAAQEESGTPTLFSATGSTEDYDAIVNAIQEDYPFFELDVVTGRGVGLAQRFRSEKDAGQVTADMVMNTYPLMRSREVTTEHFESGVSEDFAIVKDLPNPTYTDFSTTPFNYGPLYCIISNNDMVQEQGIELGPLQENDWNGFLNDQYADTDVVWSQVPNWNSFGFVLENQSQKANMEPEEWLSSMQDHLNFIFTDGHSAGMRQMGAGAAPLMFGGYTHHPPRYSDELSAEALLPKEAPQFPHNYGIYKTHESEQPWQTRFFQSVVMEESFQQMLANPETGPGFFWPGRPDLDYSDSGMAEYKLNLLETDMVQLDFSDTGRLATLAEETFNSVFGDLG